MPRLLSCTGTGRIQVRAGRIIAGAFKTTAGPALVFLRTINLQLNIFLNDALLRLVSSPAYEYIRSFREQTTTPSRLNPIKVQIRNHFKKLSPLHRLEIRFSAIYKKSLDNLEKRSSFPTLP